MEWIAMIFMKEKIYARIFEEAKHYHIYIKKTKYFQQSLNINLQNNDRNSLKSKKKMKFAIFMFLYVIMNCIGASCVSRSSIPSWKLLTNYDHEGFAAYVQMSMKRYEA